MESSEIIKLLLEVLGVAAAAGLTLKVVMSRKNSKKSDFRVVSVKNNSAGGDIIAGDSTKIYKK